MADLWFRLAVNFPRHPKVIQAGPDAAWLAVCAMAYCREHLTDGVLPKAVVPTLAAVKRPLIVAARLVAVGLWEIHPPDAYLVHDFLQWNPSRSDVELKRDKWKDTKRTQRSVHDGQDIGQVVGQSVGQGLDENETPHAHAGAPARSAHSASVSSLPVVGVSERGEGETTEVPPVWRQRGRTPTLSQSPIAHTQCYPSAGCGRGLCVPPFIASEWLGQSSGDTKYLDDFIATTLRFTPNSPQGDPAKWWRAQWDVKHRAPLTSTKGSRTVAAGNRLQAKLDAGAEIDPYGTKADARDAAKQLADKASA